MYIIRMEGWRSFSLSSASPAPPPPPLSLPHSSASFFQLRHLSSPRFSANIGIPVSPRGTRPDPRNMIQSTTATLDGETEPSSRSELEAKILVGDIDIELIENYNAFRELGGIPTDAMRQQLRRAMEKLKAEQNTPYIPPDPSPQSSTSRAVTIKTSGPPVIDGTVVKEVAATAIGAAATVAVSYWQSKAAQDQSEAARARESAARAEMAAEREREAATRAGERMDQLFIWGITTASKFATDYTMNKKKS